MITPEKKVKRMVEGILKEFGAYHFFTFSSGFSSSGIPDITGCYMGRFFGIECKAGKNTLSALQRMQLDRISDAGGHTLVINEENVEDVREMLMNIRGDYGK